MVYKCSNCGADINRYISHKDSINFFCDRKCQGMWRSKNYVGSKSPLWKGGKVEKICLVCFQSFLVNKARASEEKRGKYCSRECYDEVQKTRRGSQASRWKGGLAKENEVARKRADYREWRKAVFERDDYMCQDCKRRGVYLHAHHIKHFSEYPELRTSITNGLTLCKDCHRKIHFDV